MANPKTALELMKARYEAYVQGDIDFIKKTHDPKTAKGINWEDAREWSKTALEPLVGESLEVYPVSPVVGLHVGPAAGISYYCEKPVEGKCNCSVSELITYV